MLKFKKAACFLMAFMLSIGSASISYAQSDEYNLEDSAERLLSESLRYYSTYNAQNEYFLGEKINAYSVDNGEVTDYTASEYYPIYSNEEIIGICTLNRADEKYPSCAYSKSFSSELSDLINFGYEQYCIVVDGNKLYLTDGTKSDLLFEYYAYSLDENVNTYELENEESFSIDDLNVGGFSYNTLGEIQSELNPEINMNLRSFTMTSIPVPAYKQPTSATCWATCIHSIIQSIRFELIPDSSGIMKLVNEVKQNSETKDLVDSEGGLLTRHVGKILKEIYNVDSEFLFRQLTADEILYQINDAVYIYKSPSGKLREEYGVPVYMSWQSKKRGHSTVLTGYAYETEEKYCDIFYMDPIKGEEVFMERANDGSYSYVSGSENDKQVFTWAGTIIPDASEYTGP